MQIVFLNGATHVVPYADILKRLNLVLITHAANVALMK
jgi:hypothetical protein